MNWSLFRKFQFIKQKQGRTSIRGNLVCALVPLHSEQGAAPLAPLCGYPLKAKGVTTSSRLWPILLSYEQRPNRGGVFAWYGTG